MLGRLSSKFKRPAPAGPSETLRSFSVSDRTITESGVSPDEGGWRIEARDAGSVRLFELDELDVERCLLTYRAELKAADVEGGAYLELWCRLPDRGEFFSKGLQQKAKGTTDWSSYEVPFTLKAGERPDLIRLNIAFDGPGKLWARNIELLQTPLA